MTSVPTLTLIARQTLRVGALFFACSSALVACTDDIKSSDASPDLINGVDMVSDTIKDVVPDTTLTPDMSGVSDQSADWGQDTGLEDEPLDVSVPRDQGGVDVVPDTIEDVVPDTIEDVVPDTMDASVDMTDMSGPTNGGCISGATGTHVVRFKWRGNGPGSRAYVGYESNTLPDQSRWTAGANSRGAVGYMPVFSDTFLGAGGLDMPSTVFMDVELSTMGLPTVRNATIALLGRSFNTTSAASFEWQSFDGTGMAPAGAVSNSAPYMWTMADATTALPAGNAGVLLRIKPRGRLVINSVEICFDAP